MSHYKGKLQSENTPTQQVDLFFTEVTITIRSNTTSTELNDTNMLVQEITNVVVFSHQILVYFSSHPHWVLRLDEPSTMTAFRSLYRKKPFMGRMRYRIWHSMQAKVIMGTLLVILLVLAGVAWGLPWLGNRLLQAIPAKYEIQVGEALLQPSLADAVVDSSRTVLVNRFFEALHYPISYPVHITVVKSTEVNAYALPGGPIVVYGAILDKMKQPEELAALLSHESAHIQYRHTLRNMVSAAGTRIVIGLLLGDQGGAIALLAAQANELKGLAYSRTLETEADSKGVHWMQQQHIDPAGMLQLMRVLQSTVKGHEPAAFLSTHPVFDQRIPDIEAQIEKDIPVDLQKKAMLQSIFDKLLKAKS